MGQFDGKSRAKDAELLPLRRKRIGAVIGDERERDRCGALPRKREKVDATMNSRQRESFADDDDAPRAIGNFQIAENLPEKIALEDNTSGGKIAEYECTSRKFDDHSKISTNMSSRTDGDHSPTTANSDERLSLAKEMARDKARTKDISAMVDDQETASAVPPKSSTPELLCEEVGTGSPFRVTIPRSAIKLNLNAYGSSHQRYRKEVHRRSSTEISIADSSVTDDDDEDDENEGANGSNTSRETSASVVGVANENSNSRMKPKIIEDVTCVEGTIFARAPPNSSNSATSLPSVTWLEDPTPDEPETSSVSLNPRQSSAWIIPRTITKKRALAVSFSGKKLRLRRKFRQIFGNDLTLSELDEEEDIVERFVRKRRKKKARSSLDSGVSLTDSNTNDMLVEQRDDTVDLTEHGGSLDEKLDAASTPEVCSVDKKESLVPETPSAPSMPPLDGSPIRVSSTRESPLPEVHSLPDSSTSDVIHVKTETNDARYDDKTPKTNGKVTILVSPVNPESPDAFSPVSLEIEVPCDDNTHRVPTPITSPESTTLRVRSETIIVDYSRTGSSSADSGVTVTIGRDNPEQNEEATISLVDETPSEMPTSESRDIDASVIVSEPPNPPLTEDPPLTENEGESPAVAINEGNVEVVLPPPVSFPKLRVLRPSELGSRWCPTPHNVPPPSNDSHASQSPLVATESLPPRDDHPTINVNFQRTTLVPDNSLPSVGPRQSFDYDSTSTIIHTNNSTIINNNNNSTNYPLQLANFAAPAARPSRIIVPNNSPMVYTIALLMSLDACIQKYNMLDHRYDTSTLQREFHTKREQLWQILSRLGMQIGALDIRHIVDYVMRHYEAAVPAARRTFNREKFVNVLSTERLEPSTMRLPSEGTATRNIPIAPAPQFLPHPPPPYPTLPNFGYSTPVYPPRQPLPVHNLADQCCSDQSARGSSSQTTSTIFTPQQLKTLWNHVLWYKYLHSRVPAQQPSPVQQPSPALVPGPRPRRTPKAKGTAAPKESAATRNSIIVSANDYGTRRTPLEGNPPQRDESRVVSTPSTIRQPENASPRGLPSVDHLAATPQSNASVSVNDVLQTLARLSSPSCSHNEGHTENGCRNASREQIISPSTTGETSPEAIGNTAETKPEHAENPNDETKADNAVKANDETKADNAVNANDETSVDDAATTLSDSQSSVVILDDDDEANSDDIEPNFSILDVKTITKDVFNNMGESAAATSAIVEFSGDTNEHEDTSVAKIDSTGCLRCGEPCCVVCEQCYEAFYCSSECHEAHWTEHHHLTCRPVPAEALARLQYSATSPKDTLYSYDKLDVEQTWR